jgi:hypothetical protein
MKIASNNIRWDDIRQHAVGGFELSMITVILTIIFELISLDTVRNLCSKQLNGTNLYITSIIRNIINHFVLGVPVYVVAAMLFCETPTTTPGDTTKYLNGMVIFRQVLFILILQSLQYYHIHKKFHESTTLYSMFHRFHHRFNTYVPPSAANAVTCGEYMLAYVLPFGIAALLIGPYIISLQIAIMLTSTMNIIVHTPRIEGWSENHIPYFWVSTSDHLNHHRKLHKHYASPTFNIDNVIARLSVNKNGGDGGDDGNLN